MPFPVTVDASLSSAEQPGKYGPFLSGSRFQVLFLVNPGLNTATLAAEKSTDGGLTWVQVDAAHAPVGVYSGPGTFAPYACTQAGSVLYVAYTDNLLGLALVAFDCAAGLWGTPAAIPAPPGGGSSGEGGFPLYQWALAFSAFDSSLLFVLAGDSVTLNNVTHSICAFSRYNIGSATWSAWADLGYLDYANITTWDQVPCGLVVNPVTGKAVVFSQQVSRAGPGTAQSAGYPSPGANTFTVPLDASPTGVIEAWAGGAGPSNTGFTPSGGGGGGAFSMLGAFAWTLGTTYNLSVGAGGAPVTDGQDTWFDTVGTLLAKAGTHGAAPNLGGAGGLAAAGVGDTKQNGGAGGVPSGTAGGGGGGAGDVGVDGGPGGPGGVGVGGAGGTSGVTGGAGGGGGALNFDGIAGSGPGGGAGGSGDASPGSVTDPQGAGGQLSISWTSVRNTNNSRVFQQMVNADNTLGPLTEITAAAFPSRGRLSAPIPISFDAAIRNGIVSIAFTGAISTTGRDNITVGVGAIASPVAFTFQTFTCGNGGNNADSCPAVAPAAAGLYCCYISAPTGGPVAFEYVLDSGSGFGAPVTIGTLTTGNVHAESRLQAAVLVAAPEITWGTPTYANKAYVPPT